MPPTRVSAAREYALQVLHAVLTHRRLLDEVLEDPPSFPLQDNDKALAREIISGTCRQWGKIRYTLKQIAKDPGGFPPVLQRILELSAYQILFLDRVPGFAVVSDAVNLAKCKKSGRLSKAVNAILRNLIRRQDTLSYPRPSEGFAEYLAINYSHPQWLIEAWLSLWEPEKVEDLCRFNNTRAGLSLRIRSRIEQATEFLNALECRYSFHSLLPHVLTLQEPFVLDMQEFQNPHALIQDPVMTLPALILNPQPGWKVWDVCAAPGGKSFHIADLMQDKGILFSTDRSAARLQRLSAQREFLGYFGIQPLVLNPLRDTLPPEMNDLDAVLLDVPCTGWGTFRRHPDLRWRLQPGDSHRLGNKAYSLLQCASTRVKPGGIIVYSTCTLSPFENEQVIERFVQQNDSYRIEDISDAIPNEWRSCLHVVGKREGNCFTAFPPVTQTDGAFIARLRNIRT